jgi:hypothetical protein
MLELFYLRFDTTTQQVIVTASPAQLQTTKRKKILENAKNKQKKNSSNVFIKKC